MATRATAGPWRAVLALVGALAVVALLWWQQSPAEPGAEPTSGLPVVEVDELPPEARDTLDLIERGGPYPYEQDDGVFLNREGLLPDRPEGHYREYTVETPGSPDRGARRIVAGEDGERYWTDDHYASFREIIG